MSASQKKVRIYPLTAAGIAPYGIIIDASCVNDDRKKNCYGILLKERSKGWRIGYLIARERIVRALERHPDSLETFEPVKGRSIIALARARYPQEVKVFHLDKPVVIRKNVWHDVAPIRGVSEIKIFENIDVVTEHMPLQDPVRLP